jgi:hypothetical protein
MRQELAHSSSIVHQPTIGRGMQQGIAQIVQAVRPTLGPCPRLVAIENVLRNHTPELLDDGGQP